MFCEQCGAKLDDHMKFCVQCGAAVPEKKDKVAHVPEKTTTVLAAEDAGNAPQEALSQPASSVSPAPELESTEQSQVSNVASEEALKQPQHTQHRLMIGIVIAAAVIAVGLIAGILIWQHFEYEKAHEPISLHITVNAADVSVDETRGVPVNVRGTDLDDNGVDEDILITSSHEEIELMRGDYSITVLGNTISDDGYVYAHKTAETSVIIEEDAASAEETASELGDIALEFAVVPPQDVTDEELNAIREWMEEFDLPAEEIEDSIQSAKDVRQVELDRIAEEERQRAEEEARAKAEALRQAAFGSFPATFSFASGAGGWSTDMIIQPDGSFEGQWHDSNLGEDGPGYMGAIHICEFAGSFSVVEQVNETTFRLQLNEVHPTHRAGEYIEDNVLHKYYDDTPYGLGEMTSTPEEGWTLYLPGTSASVLNDAERGWLYGVVGPIEGSTLTDMVLTNGGEFTWAGSN